MKPNKKYFLQYLTVLWLVVSGLIFSSCSSVKQPNDDMALLKEHYGSYAVMDKFALSYEQLVPTPYQSYDYRKPDSLHNSMNIEIDLKKNQFFAPRVFRYPGGLSFQYTEYNDGSEGYWYDGGNRTAMGNFLFEGDEEKINTIEVETRRLVDLLTVQHLLFNQQTTDTVYQIESKHENEIKIEEVRNVTDTVMYTFTRMPVSLLSVHYKTDNQSYIFSAQRTIGTFHVAGKIEVLTDGKHQYTCIINSFEAIDKIEEQKLMLPEGRNLFNPDGEVPLKAIAISEGTYVIQYLAARRNVMLRVSGNDIIVLGAPGRNSMSEKVIELVERKFPDKQIKHVYVSHFHMDHTAGLRAYARKGISIVSDQYSIEAIKANPVFISDGMTFLPIVHKQTMMGVTFYLLENSHSKGQTFAYIPEAKAIYEGDFLEMPIDKSIPSHMPKSTKTFLDYIAQEKIDVERIVGHHTSDNISREMIQAYLAKEDSASYKGQ